MLGCLVRPHWSALTGSFWSLPPAWSLLSCLSTQSAFASDTAEVFLTFGDDQALVVDIGIEHGGTLLDWWWLGLVACVSGRENAGIGWRVARVWCLNRSGEASESNEDGNTRWRRVGDRDRGHVVHGVPPFLWTYVTQRIARCMRAINWVSRIHPYCRIPMAISIEMCLSGRELTEPRPSPSGASVAFVMRWANTSAIVILLSDGGPERIATTKPEPVPGRGLGGGCFDWMPDNSGLVYAATDGNLWLQPVPGGPPTRITNVGTMQRVEGPAVMPSGTSVLGVVDQAEVWCWPLDGLGTPTRLDDGSADFVFDPFPMPSGTGAIWHAWNVPDMSWDSSRVESITFDGSVRDQGVPSGAVQQPRMMPDGISINVRDDTGFLNVWLGDQPLVDEPFEHAGPAWGMGQRSFAHSEDGSAVAFTRNEGGFGRLCVVDLGTRAVREVARGVHGQLGWRRDRLVALRTGARTPTQIVSYNTTTWERTVLAIGPVGGWEATDLPEPHLVEVECEVECDGTVLHARRYVAGNGRTLCWIHGGPTDQWQVEFMPRVAYWWSRGWDILVPDPRGSTGHGRAYQQALRGNWGRLDVEDAAAILRSSHERGWSAADRTVMMGSSSGGLTALGVLGLHRGLAAAGVVLYPVTDFAVLAENSHRFEAHYTLSLVGPLDDHEMYRDRSPLAYADRIDVPLLVMHGDSDPVVPLSSTIELVEQIRSHGGDVELIVFDGEGHGFRNPANRRADYERTAEFLTRVVGNGSATPDR